MSSEEKPKVSGTTQDALSESQRQSLPNQKACIVVSDDANRRLLETIARSLELEPSVAEVEELKAGRFMDYELVIADEAVARELQPAIVAEQIEREQIKPTLIAIVAQPYRPALKGSDEDTFDAVLAMPEKPGLLTAQLGVALYTHRAFARRYQSALEELNLNRNIFRSVTNGISIANAQLPDMPLMYVNPAFEAMTGCTQEEVEGKNCRFLQNGDNDQPGLTLIREAIAQKRETVAVLKNFRKDGRLFWNELAISPIRNREGEMTHFVGIQMDVTERVELESALRESEKLAAVGRLASAISHEINNPLEAVTNLIYLIDQLLPKKPENEEIQKFLKQADQELQRMKLITAQSLRFSKQSHGPEAITCEALLEPILEIYAPRFANYNVKLETRFRSDQHVVCLASEIRQVLTNLVTNALHAMQKFGGRMVIHTHEATDWQTERRGVIITIADTGEGMSPETKKNLYRAFYTTKGIQGTGLGLWISAEIVQRHKGRLRVRSSDLPEAHGTVFQLFLPFQAAAGENASDQGTERTGQGTANGLAGGSRSLPVRNA